MDKSYFIFGAILLLLDIPFIIIVMKPIYNSINLATETNVIFAILAYIFMISSWHLIKGNPWTAAEVALGIYGTFAFTLGAVLPSYKFKYALIEIVWGTILFVFSTILTNKLK